MKLPNRTKIVATLGPASNNPKTILQLIEAGVNIFRLNCSHQDHKGMVANTKMIRAAAKRSKRSIGVLADLQGPKIRVGKLTEPIGLKTRQTVIVTTKPNFIASPAAPGETQKISCGYGNLHKDVKPGESILMDDGNLELQVLSIKGREVSCKVVHGGPLKQYKGINLPGSKVSAPALTKKDEADLAQALALDVDYVALSFVRTAADVRGLTKRIKASGKQAKVISKLERPEVVDHLDDIIEASYAVMVARGDMGVELGPELVPALQKKIIARCIRTCTPVITATQMLESMMNNPRPTRAEASDVANAVHDGTTAVMLSGETAAGKFPVRTVQIMSKIVEQTEMDVFGDEWSYSPNWNKSKNEIASVPRATCHAAARGALEADCSAIAVFTESGFTARYMAAERLPIPVVAFSPNQHTVQRLALGFGIHSRLVRKAKTSLMMTEEGEKILLREGIAKKGDRVMMVFGTSRAPGFTNIVNIRILGGAAA